LKQNHVLGKTKTQFPYAVCRTLDNVHRRSVRQSCPHQIEWNVCRTTMD